jgi:hypothetical protein
MRVLLSCAMLLLPVLTVASCTGDDEAAVHDLALRAQEVLAPTLPRELVPGVRLGASAVEGTRLDLVLTPAADRAVLLDELAPPVCAIEAAKALAKAGGTLRFMVGAREIGTVTTCPET